MKAILRSLRISPKKVNLVADLVRMKPVEWAIDFLRFTPKHSARPMMETIKSAVANAEENFKQKRADLFISKIIVNEGATLKRFRPVSRGRSHPIMKRTSHITIELSVTPTLSSTAKMGPATKGAKAHAAVPADAPKEAATKPVEAKVAKPKAAKKAE